MDIDPDTYNKFVDTPNRKKWTLKGSIIVKSGVDIDESLARAKEVRIRRWRERRGKMEKLLRSRSV